jgi:hypothetical protein
MKQIASATLTDDRGIGLAFLEQGPDGHRRIGQEVTAHELVDDIKARLIEHHADDEGFAGGKRNERLMVPGQVNGVDAAGHPGKGAFPRLGEIAGARGHHLRLLLRHPDEVGRGLRPGGGLALARRDRPSLDSFQAGEAGRERHEVFEGLLPLGDLILKLSCRGILALDVRS